MGKKFEFFTGFNVYPRPKDIYMCESRLSLNVIMVPAVFCENLFKFRCDRVISGNKLNGKIFNVQNDILLKISALGFFL